MELALSPRRQAKALPWPAWLCPECGGQLAESSDAFACARGHEFPIVAGIPRFVRSSGYAAAFGLQWKRYRTTQLDSHTGLRVTAARAQRILGDQLWSSLADKTVLECGCGAGRFTEILLDIGARVTSIDLSDAVDANVRNCPLGERHRAAQADIGNLPFAPGQFDVVFGLGVVQHTPSPERTIASLSAQVRPGGWLVIDHYTHNLSDYTKTAPLVRQVFLRLSPESGMRGTEWLVDKLLPLHKRVRTVRVAQKLLSRISPVLSYYHVLPELPDEYQREWALLDTHDSLTDKYKHFRTEKQLRATFDSVGMDVTWAARAGNGIELRARKPASTL